MTDFRSWPKKWNDTSLGDYVALPEFKQSSQWPLFGMLVLGLVAGAAIGGYAVSQRAQMKRLAKHARRMGDELAAMGNADSDKPAAATRSNHRRKATSEV
ncbi:MAG TPA: hypothetical protein VIO80_03980 [Candidatus Dormibacteraeota bacterium]|jgi:uncharacterized protein YneF (UPF0154 family)